MSRQETEHESERSTEMEIPISKNQIVRISERLDGGNKRIEILPYVRNNKGEFVPTSKGVSFPTDLLDEIINGLADFQQQEQTVDSEDWIEHAGQEKVHRDEGKVVICQVTEPNQDEKRVIMCEVEIIHQGGGKVVLEVEKRQL